MINKYLIHDNGGRPFLVEYNTKSNIVSVFKRENKTNEIYNIEVLRLEIKKIFVGKSTNIEDNGNSILILTLDNYYIYIGWEIFKFKSQSSILFFSSKIGNNDFPYPYAICRNGSCILFVEKIILLNFFNKYSSNDPYDDYYNPGPHNNNIPRSELTRIKHNLNFIMINHRID